MGDPTERDDDLNLDELAPDVDESPPLEPEPPPATPEPPVEEFPDPDISDEPTPAPLASGPTQGREGTPSQTPPHPPVSTFDTRPQAPPLPTVPQPSFKFYSRHELRSAVDQGVINEDQMVDQLELQNREQAKIDAIKYMQEQTVQQSITSQLSEYDRLVPGWRTENSAANQKAVPEYTRLLRMGLPNSDATRLLALENTFGTIQRMHEARATQARTTEQRPTPPSSGRRGGAPSTNTPKKDILKALPKDQLRAYQELIGKGLYKNWSEVREEVNYGAKQTVNARLREKTVNLTR